jgi:sec-independent protein translocase protein TatA
MKCSPSGLSATARWGEKELYMFGRLGLPELMIILFIVILIFGANRLPDIGRGIGRGIKNFKDATKDGARKEES